VPLSRKEWLALIVLLLLATVLRVAWPRLTEFKFSEARLEALALELTHDGHLPLVGVPSSAGFDHSPISVYLYIPAFLFATDPIPATVYGGLVNVASVALCWWLARRWPGGGRWAAAVAGLLFAVSPWAVAFSRKIWQVAFVPLLALAFVGLAISALVGGRRWHLAWAVAIYALLVQVHPSAVSLAPALFLWLIIFRQQVRPGPLLVGGALGLLTAVPFLIHQVQNGWPIIAAYRALPDATWDLTAVRLAWEMVTGRGIHALAGDAYPLLEIVPQLGWFFNLVGWMTIGAVLGLAWRMVKTWKDETPNRQAAARIDLMLLSWLLIPILFSLRHNMELHLHFFALVAPAAYLLAGRAAEALGQEAWFHAGSWGRALKLVGLAALGFVALAQVVALGLMARFVAIHETPNGFGVPLGRYMDVADAAVAVAAETDAAEVLVVGPGDSVVVDETPAIFDVLLRRRVPDRFVVWHATALFPPHGAVALLSPEAGEASVWYTAWPYYQVGEGYSLVVLDGSWPQHGLEPVPAPRTLENGIELQGYAWEVSAGTAGNPFWLLWQVLWLDPDDTHFFVHMLNEGGGVWAQGDAVGYPTANRRKGDRAISKFDITFGDNASPGSQTWARIGMYLYPEVVNVPVIDGQGNRVGDAVVIGPLNGGP
jgi:hypothetical protein